MGNETDLHVEEHNDGSASVVDPTALPLEQEANNAGVDTRTTNNSGDDDATAAAGDEAAAANATSDAEREAIRERRRQERADKKAAQREREDNLRQALVIRDQQIAELSQRVAQQEQRNTTADLAQLDATIKRSADSMAYYKGVIQEATSKQDGAAVAEATERMILARGEAERLLGIKRSLTTQTSSQPQALDPRVKSFAETWIRDNPWYDPSGKDEDSDVALTIDKRLVADGFDPRTPTYWDELNKRVAKYLPHHAPRPERGHNGSNPPQGRPASRTPVAGSGRESGAQGSSSSNGSTYQLSAARVQALKDAGVWDDPKSRAEHIKNYREYDRARSSEQR